MKTFGAAYVNLLKTSIGSGVLSFPYLFKTYGVILAVLLTLITGFFATMGLLLLTLCSQVIGRNADFGKLANRTIPLARAFVDLSVFLKCFGVSLSYVIITGDLLPLITSNTIPSDSIFASPPVMLFIFILFVAPFTYFSKVDKLKYTSFLGVFSILLVILAAALRYANTEITHSGIILLAPFSINWITGLGKFIFSFTCHQNLFSVNSEMDDNSVPTMKKLICAVSLSSFSMYMSFGMINYMLYGENVTENVLNSYPNDGLATIVRGLYVIVMGVSYPLQLTPARTYLLNMIGVSKEKKGYKLIYYLSTTVLVMATYLIAISGAQLGIVYSIVGATASCFMCLILPALFYFNLEIEKNYKITMAAYISFLLGVFIFVTTIFAMIYKEF